jgi:hypothetical protein
VGRVCITSLGKFAVAEISNFQTSVSQIATGGAILGEATAKKRGSELMGLIKRFKQDFHHLFS